MFRVLVSGILLFLVIPSLSIKAEITVFAASSTTEVIQELGRVFKEKQNITLHYNLAGSGMLARQIEAGAPADLFISANTQWMDWLCEKGVIESTDTFNLATNSLVLVAPKGSTLTFNKNITGRIAVGNFKSVPAGMYARESLSNLGWLECWNPNLVMTSNVRTALLYVERGEVAAGIVYATDARVSKKTVVLGTFPEESHSPILYPVARCSDNPEAQAFIRFLKSKEARNILNKHGFR